MKTYKSVLIDTHHTEQVKELIGVYEELAAAKMQTIRQEILVSREFFEKLEQLSDEVGNDFAQLVHPEEVTGKVTAVFIGANSGLYGNIIDETFKQFLNYITSHTTEVFIIGKTGEDLMHTLAPNIPFTLINFPDDTIEQQSVDQVLTTLFPYKKIVVFYGKFLNIATQHPAMSTISGDTLQQSDPFDLDEKKKHFMYYYEPSLLAVSEIFANEILSSLMEQILRESQLAKYASRLMYLDEALENVDIELRSLEKYKRRIQRKTAGKKQTAMVSRMIVTGGNL